MAYTYIWCPWSTGDLGAPFLLLQVPVPFPPSLEPHKNTKTSPGMTGQTHTGCISLIPLARDLGGERALVLVVLALFTPVLLDAPPNFQMNHTWSLNLNYECLALT